MIILIPTPILCTADADAEISASAVHNLQRKVDLIETTTDNNRVSAYTSLVIVANESKVPLITSSPVSNYYGTVAIIGMNYCMI